MGNDSFGTKGAIERYKQQKLSCENLPLTLDCHNHRLPQIAACVLLVKGEEGTTTPAPGIFLTSASNSLIIKAWFVIRSSPEAESMIT